MCFLFVYTLLKVVSYYDLCVLSMSVTGFPKKSLDGRELYPSLFWIFGILLTLQSPLEPLHLYCIMHSSYVSSRRQDPRIPTELTVLPDIHWTLERLRVIPDACVST